ncbi:MAG: helix-turn-helix domain-containing protein [Candidatus Heimdallarchaeota archaeon]
MRKNSKNSFKDLSDFFAKEPTINQKAWGLIHDFYNLVLTQMEKENITKADLARRLGKSRSAISQMFNKTPNVSIKKMVEIADAVGLDISIVPAHRPYQSNEVRYSMYVSDKKSK